MTTLLTSAGRALPWALVVGWSAVQWKTAQKTGLEAENSALREQVEHWKSLSVRALRVQLQAMSEALEEALADSERVNQQNAELREARCNLREELDKVSTASRRLARVEIFDPQKGTTRVLREVQVLDEALDTIQGWKTVGREGYKMHYRIIPNKNEKS